MMGFIIIIANFAFQSTLMMKEQRDYIRDLTEIRSMMERSSKFLSLSGWAGILAGSYAVAGAFIAWKVLDFSTDSIPSGTAHPAEFSGQMLNLVILALVVLVLALGSAIWDSNRKAGKRGEKAWNATSKRMLASMSVPLVSGGILTLILILKGYIGFIFPLTLIFYGLALYNASKFTFSEVKIMGMIQIILGLVCSLIMEYGLLLWTIGFGLVHIVYGIYMFMKYER